MKNLVIFLFSFILLSSCSNQENSKVDADPFDAAYPSIYTDLGLPQYRRGAVQDVTGKSLGVKTEHVITIFTDDTPQQVKAFLDTEIKKIGWKEIESGRARLSEFTDVDLYRAQYINGTNKFDVNAFAEPDGRTKIRISLSVFKAN